MKKRISLLLVLGAFYWMNTATSITKDPFYVCDDQIGRYLIQRDTILSYYSGPTNDTLIIRTWGNSDWDQKTSEICQLLKDSCQIKAPYKIMVLDSTSDINLWNTPYGKQVYFRQCP